MKRAFLDSPEAWTRASRTSETAVESAYALHHVRRAPAIQPHEWALLFIVAAVVAGIVFGGI